MKNIVQSMKALDDLTRLKIFKLISRTELCVCELADIMKISQSAVSQHLNKLKAVELVTERRSGQWIYYTANPKQVDLFVNQLVDFFASDIDSFAEMEMEAAQLSLLEKGDAMVCSPERREKQ